MCLHWCLLIVMPNHYLSPPARYQPVGTVSHQDLTNRLHCLVVQKAGGSLKGMIVPQLAIAKDRYQPPSHLPNILLLLSAACNVLFRTDTVYMRLLEMGAVFANNVLRKYRTGEACGLKLVFSTRDTSRDCEACIKIVAQQRQIAKMTDLERWRRDGNRPATVERTESEVAGLRHSISQLWKRHLKGLFGGPQQRHRTGRTCQ